MWPIDQTKNKKKRKKEMAKGSSLKKVKMMKEGILEGIRKEGKTG